MKLKTDFWTRNLHKFNINVAERICYQMDYSVKVRKADREDGDIVEHTSNISEMIINEIQSATTVEDIKGILIGIYGHIIKMKVKVLMEFDWKFIDAFKHVLTEHDPAEDIVIALSFFRNSYYELYGEFPVIPESIKMYVIQNEQINLWEISGLY